MNNLSQTFFGSCCFYTDSDFWKVNPSIFPISFLWIWKFAIKFSNSWTYPGISIPVLALIASLTPISAMGARWCTEFLYYSCVSVEVTALLMAANSLQHIMWYLCRAEELLQFSKIFFWMGESFNNCFISSFFSSSLTNFW